MSKQSDLVSVSQGSGGDPLYIDTTNDRVGVGTTSPTRQLEVSKAGTSYIRAADTTNSVNVDLLAASSGGWVGTQSNHPFLLQTNNTERMRIDNAGRVTKPYQPSFQVYSTPSKDGSNYVYGFGTVPHNIGGHYNNSNGRFTAPVDGRYLFMASIWATSGTNNYMVFVINGVENIGGHVEANSAATSCHANAVIDMNSGDWVQLRVDFTIQGSTPRNNWQGYLLG